MAEDFESLGVMGSLFAEPSGRRVTPPAVVPPPPSSFDDRGRRKTKARDRSPGRSPGRSPASPSRSRSPRRGGSPGRGTPTTATTDAGDHDERPGSSSAGQRRAARHTVRSRIAQKSPGGTGGAKALAADLVSYAEHRVALDANYLGPRNLPQESPPVSREAAARPGTGDRWRFPGGLPEVGDDPHSRGSGRAAAAAAANDEGSYASAGPGAAPPSPTRVPKRYHKNAQVAMRPKGLAPGSEGPDTAYQDETGQWYLRKFPTVKAAGREEVGHLSVAWDHVSRGLRPVARALAVELKTIEGAGEMPSRHGLGHFRKPDAHDSDDAAAVAAKAAAEAQLTDEEVSLMIAGVPTWAAMDAALARVGELADVEKLVYDLAAHEIARQVSTASRERGDLLTRVRRQYVTWLKHTRYSADTVRRGLSRHRERDNARDTQLAALRRKIETLEEEKLALVDKLDAKAAAMKLAVAAFMAGRGEDGLTPEERAKKVLGRFLHKALYLNKRWRGRASEIADRVGRFWRCRAARVVMRAVRENRRVCTKHATKLQAVWRSVSLRRQVARAQALVRFKHRCATKIAATYRMSFQRRAYLRAWRENLRQPELKLMRALMPILREVNSKIARVEELCQFKGGTQRTQRLLQKLQRAVIDSDDDESDNDNDKEEGSAVRVDCTLVDAPDATDRHLFEEWAADMKLRAIDLARSVQMQKAMDRSRARVKLFIKQGALEARADMVRQHIDDLVAGGQQPSSYTGNNRASRANFGGGRQQSFYGGAGGSSKAKLGSTSRLGGRQGSRAGLGGPGGGSRARLTGWGGGSRTGLGLGKAGVGSSTRLNGTMARLGAGAGSSTRLPSFNKGSTTRLGGLGPIGGGASPPKRGIQRRKSTRISGGGASPGSGLATAHSGMVGAHAPLGAASGAIVGSGRGGGVAVPAPAAYGGGSSRRVTGILNAIENEPMAAMEWMGQNEVAFEGRVDFSEALSTFKYGVSAPPIAREVGVQKIKDVQDVVNRLKRQRLDPPRGSAKSGDFDDSDSDSNSDSDLAGSSVDKQRGFGSLLTTGSDRTRGSGSVVEAESSVLTKRGSIAERRERKASSRNPVAPSATVNRGRRPTVHGTTLVAALPSVQLEGGAGAKGAVGSPKKLAPAAPTRSSIRAAIRGSLHVVGPGTNTSEKAVAAIAKDAQIELKLSTWEDEYESRIAKGLTADLGHPQLALEGLFEMFKKPHEAKPAAKDVPFDEHELELLPCEALIGRIAMTARIVKNAPRPQRWLHKLANVLYAQLTVDFKGSSSIVSLGPVGRKFVIPPLGHVPPVAPVPTQLRDAMRTGWNLMDGGAASRLAHRAYLPCGAACVDASVHVYRLLGRLRGLPEIVDQAVLDMAVSVQTHAATDTHARLLAELLRSYKPAPALPFTLAVLELLRTEWRLGRLWQRKELKATSAGASATSPAAHAATDPDSEYVTVAHALEASTMLFCVAPNKAHAVCRMEAEACRAGPLAPAPDYGLAALEGGPVLSASEELYAAFVRRLVRDAARLPLTTAGGARESHRRVAVEADGVLVGDRSLAGDAATASLVFGATLSKREAARKAAAEGVPALELLLGAAMPLIDFVSLCVDEHVRQAHRLQHAQIATAMFDQAEQRSRMSRGVSAAHAASPAAAAAAAADGGLHGVMGVKTFVEMLEPFVVETTHDPEAAREKLRVLYASAVRRSPRASMDFSTFFSLTRDLVIEQLDRPHPPVEAYRLLSGAIETDATRQQLAKNGGEDASVAGSTVAPGLEIGVPQAKALLESDDDESDDDVSAITGGGGKGDDVREAEIPGLVSGGQRPLESVMAKSGLTRGATRR